MSFPTATTWCVGTMSSLVATMTRRSGSGTAGDRLCLAQGQAPMFSFLPVTVEPCGTLGKGGCAGLGPVKAQLLDLCHLSASPSNLGTLPGP